MTIRIIIPSDGYQLCPACNGEGCPACREMGELPSQSEPVKPSPLAGSTGSDFGPRRGIQAPTKDIK